MLSGSEKSTGYFAVSGMYNSTINEGTRQCPAVAFNVRANESGTTRRLSSYMRKGFLVPHVVSIIHHPSSIIHHSSFIHQVGDGLVCVNHERLTLLNHENVVRVLRGLLSTSGSQLLLLRFAYAEDSARLLPRPPPTPLPPKAPKPVRHSSLGDPQSEPRTPRHGDGDDDAAAGNRAKEEAFRPESWHGSVRPPGSRPSAGGPGGGERGAGRSASASPPHASGPARVRSHSLGKDSPKLLREGDGGSSGQEGGYMMMEEAAGKGWGGWSAADGVGGILTRPELRGKRRGELWGERETGLAGGGGGSRHVYLGDMGHAGAQRMLQSIAKDVQVLRLRCCSCDG